MKRSVVSIVRYLTRNVVITRRLPLEFGSLRIYVTPRSDIRLILGDLKKIKSDLFDVVNLLVDKGETVWDIGANQGILSFAGAAKTGKDGSVLAVEADSKYAQLIYESKQRIGDRISNISILCAALSEGLGMTELNVVERGHARNYILDAESRQVGAILGKKAVICVSADWLLEHYTPPDFVKVDIEGAEVLFLHGARKLLDKVCPKMYIEVDRSNVVPATQLLREYNYSLFKLINNGKNLQLQPLEACTFNTIALPNEKLDLYSKVIVREM